MGDGTMNSSAAMNVERTQTTVSVSKDALDTVDELSRSSGVSRSRLFDMAIRRFARWAQDVHPDALREIAAYETEGRTVPYVKKHSSGPYTAVSATERPSVRPTGEPRSEVKPGLAKAGYSDAPKAFRKDR